MTRKSLRRVGANGVAPWTGHGDVIAFLFPVELGAREQSRDRVQATLQVVKVRHDDADVAAPLLRRALRQVKLLRASVDPHVAGAEIDVGIARKAESADVEQGRDLLIRHREVDVLHVEHIADVLFASIELFRFSHGISSSRSSRAPRRIECPSLRPLPRATADRASGDYSHWRNEAAEWFGHFGLLG